MDRHALMTKLVSKAVSVRLDTDSYPYGYTDGTKGHLIRRYVLICERPPLSTIEAGFQYTAYIPYDADLDELVEFHLNCVSAILGLVSNESNGK